MRGGWGEGLGGHKFILTRIAHFMNYVRYKNCFILINYYFNKHRLRFLRSLFLHLENFPPRVQKIKNRTLGILHYVWEKLSCQPFSSNQLTK